MISDELLRQIADHTSDPLFVLGLSQLPNPDEVLRKAGLSHRVYDQVLTDAHVMAKVIDRRSGMLRREWQVEAGADTPRGKRAAEICRLAITEMEEHETHPLETSLGFIQEAALRGHRALEVVWKYDGGLWLPDFLRDIPGRRIIHTGVEWRLLTLDDPSLGIAFPPRKGLVATHMASTDNPYGEALLSRCFWPYMFKHNGFKWWVTLAEKHGIPWVIGKLGGQAEDSQRRDLLGKLVSLVMDAVAVLPKDAEVDIKGLEGVTPDVHERLIRITNAEMSKVLVGQTLSTELDQKGGSRAAAETHSGLRDEIVEADGKLVARTMNRLFAWITELNLGSKAEAPHFQWIDEDKPPTAWAEVVERAVKSMPNRIPVRWAYDKLGIGEEYRNDREMVGAGTKIESGLKGGDFAQETSQAETEFTEEQQALEALAERSIKEAVPTLAGNEEKIIAAVQSSASYEEAMEKLLALYPDLEVSGLEDVLTRTLLAAGAFGRATAQEESK